MVLECSLIWILLIDTINQGDIFSNPSTCMISWINSDLWPWLNGSWIYNYLCNQCLSPLMLWIRISIRVRCTTLCDKVCQWLVTGQWFSPGPTISSTNKTDSQDITEILLYPHSMSGGYIAITLSVRPSVCPSVHTFVTDISASTGRNDFIFDIWLWHGDLYRVSPFQVYRTSTSCLPCDLQMNKWGYS
jgi:hypothetical protein